MSGSPIPIALGLKRLRIPIVIAMLVIATAVLGVLVQGGRGAGALDPRSAAPSGSMALAELLRDQGVRVDVADTADAARRLARPHSTLLIADGEHVGPAQLDILAGTGRAVVVIGALDPVLTHYAVGTEIADDDVPRQALDPACPLPAAVAAGRARVGGLAYQSSETPGVTTTLCYASAGRASLVHRAGGNQTVVLLGSGDAFTNQHLGREGNAALAMNLLGSNEQLVWYLPTIGELLTSTGEEEQKSLWQLIPGGWKWAVLQLSFAAGLFALWRARRLGPVVTEPLPVVVRAAEAVEGRARLYRRVGATDRAADALRAAARDRIVPMLGLAEASDPHAVVAAAANRTGRGVPDVGALLYGAAPANDAALVKLADDLDSLTREVRRL